MYQTPDFKKRWGAFHEDIRTTSKYHVSYFLVFVMRRILYLSSAFFIVDNPGMQRLLLRFSNLAMLIHVGGGHMTSLFLNKHQMLQELMITVITMHLDVFTVWGPR